MSDWKLHFTLGPSLAGKQVTIFVNHPNNRDANVERSKFRPLPWKTEGAEEGVDISDKFAEVDMIVAGSFNYFFTLNARYVNYVIT